MRKIDPNTKFVRRQCKCGHVITFLTRFPVTCTRCGRLVYPTKEVEFMAKLKIEMRKSKYVKENEI